MSKEELFFDAITNIREELVEEAQNYVFRRRVPWRRYAGLAACLVLVVLVGYHALLDCNTVSCDSASGANGSAAPGITGSAESADGGAPEDAEPPSGDTSNNGDSQARSFTARVLEVHEACLLVEVLEGELLSGEACVPTRGLSGLEAIEAGDTVVVTFTGPVQETAPLQITGVAEIFLVE